MKLPLRSLIASRDQPAVVVLATCANTAYLHPPGFLPGWMARSAHVLHATLDDPAKQYFA